MKHGLFFISGVLILITSPIILLLCFFYELYQIGKLSIEMIKEKINSLNQESKEE